MRRHSNRSRPLRNPSKWKSVLGLVLCAAIFAFIAISESDESSLDLTGISRMGSSLARMQNSQISANQLFELKPSCKETCVQHALKRLHYALGCLEVKYLRKVHLIEARCESINDLTPWQVGEQAQAGLKDAVEGHVNNLEVHIPDEKPKHLARRLPAKEDTLTASARIGRDSHIPSKNVENDLPTSARVRHQLKGFANWGLDRVDEEKGFLALGRFDNIFDDGCFPKQGAGAIVYVIDTGCRVCISPSTRSIVWPIILATDILHCEPIFPDKRERIISLPFPFVFFVFLSFFLLWVYSQSTHEDLKGRTMDMSVAYPSGADDNGHGTHVAGIAAGTYSGVCKKCQVVCVKAMGSDGSSSANTVVESIDYVLSEHAQQSRGTPAVAVLSLAAKAKSTIFDHAIRSLSDAGIVPVVAAANYNSDACLYTPARDSSAITVGATDVVDGLLPSSNWGNWYADLLLLLRLLPIGGRIQLGYQLRLCLSKTASNIAMLGILRSMC